MKAAPLGRADVVAHQVDERRDVAGRQVDGVRALEEGLALVRAEIEARAQGREQALPLGLGEAPVRPRDVHQQRGGREPLVGLGGLDRLVGRRRAGRCR